VELQDKLLKTCEEITGIEFPVSYDYIKALWIAHYSKQ